MRVDGAEVDLVQVGQGPDVVFYHSLLTDRTAFDAVVPALARHRRLTLVNLPGFGGSSPAGPRIEDYAERMARLLAALGPGPVDLVAMSFGGFVGLALAARHGHLLRRLVVVDAAATFPEPAKAPLRALAERAEREGMAAVLDMAVRRMFTEAFIAAHPEVAEARCRVMLRTRPEHFATACRALAAVDLRPHLAAIRTPTLVIVGALDATTPPALAHELAAGIPGARLVVLPDCAHVPPIEQPTAFVAAIAPFLDIPA